MERSKPSWRRPPVPARLLLVGALSLPLALAACGQAEDAARGAASGAASSAASSAKSAASSAASGIRSAAAERVVQAVCAQTTNGGALADAQLDTKQRAVVKGLAETASAAGAPEQYVGPLKTVADSTDAQQVADAVTKLRTACESK